MTIGIGAYTCALPRRRVTRAHLESAGLTALGDWRWAGLLEPDEDALTLALVAGVPLATDALGSMALASTSLPYAQRVQSGLLATSLGLTRLYVSEHTTSARAGSEALCAHAWRLSATGQAALIVASEAGAMSLRELGRGAVAVGVRLEEGGRAATIDAIASAADERPGLQFRGTASDVVQDVAVVDYGVDAYVTLLHAALEPLLERTGASIGDFDAVVLAGVTPALANKGARAIGVGPDHWRDHAPGMTGDLGAASGLFGLVHTLDKATPGDRILLLSYGGGSAIDALALTAGQESGRGVVAEAMSPMVDADLATVLRLRGAI